MTFCVIGDPDSILGYQLAGAEGWPVNDENAARQAFQDILGREFCHVLFLIGPVDEWLRADVENHRKTARPPLVTAMPGLAGSKPGSSNLAQRMQAAIGLKPTKETGTPS